MARSIERDYIKHGARAAGSKVQDKPELRAIPLAEIPLARQNAVAAKRNDGRRRAVRPVPTKVLEQFQSAAYVQADEWHAECPFCHWINREIALTDPRFICPNTWCDGGGANGARGQALRLIVPKPEDIIRIELALELRPDKLTRGWKPPEQVADLIEQNREQKLNLSEDAVRWAFQASRSRWAYIFGEDAVARIEALLPSKWMR